MGTAAPVAGAGWAKAQHGAKTRLGGTHPGDRQGALCQCPTDALLALYPSPLGPVLRQGAVLAPRSSLLPRSWRRWRGRCTAAPSHPTGSGSGAAQRAFPTATGTNWPISTFHSKTFVRKPGRRWRRGASPRPAAAPAGLGPGWPHPRGGRDQRGTWNKAEKCPCARWEHKASARLPLAPAMPGELPAPSGAAPEWGVPHSMQSHPDPSPKPGLSPCCRRNMLPSSMVG